jgi:hypothetical protein
MAGRAASVRRAPVPSLAQAPERFSMNAWPFGRAATRGGARGFDFGGVVEMADGVAGQQNIGDWYADHEGRHLENPRYDVENDDEPDRNRDGWVDRLASDKPHEPVPAGRPGKTKRQGSRRAAASREPLSQNVIDIVHAMRAKWPGIADEQIVTLLRQHGVSDITRDLVIEAIAHKPRPEDPGPRQERIDARKPGQFVAAVRVHWAKDPSFTAKTIAARLRLRGWAEATEAEVQQVLVMLNGRSPVAKERVRKSTGSRPRRRRSARIVALTDAQGHPAPVCPSCGVAVSQLGLCRCS